MIPNLLRNLNVCISPDTLPCAGTAALHAHQHWWVLLDAAMCPQCGGASPFPDPCFSFGVYPLVLYPKDSPPTSLLLIHQPPAPSVPSDYLVHGDGDQLGHRGDWVIGVTDDNGLPLILSCACADGAFRFPPVSHFREICLSIKSQDWRVHLCMLV